MKKYWFFGLGINDNILENTLTEPQKEIILQEKLDITNKGAKKWLGVNDQKGGWYFLKHGFEIEYVPKVEDVKKARKILYDRIVNKYNLND
ncbi:MAG: hypothetical protein ACOCV1_07280 [Bacillota bacterium]